MSGASHMLTKPPAMVNRDGQWQILAEFVRGDGHGSLSFASISGRGRTGKSFLLRPAASKARCAGSVIPASRGGLRCSSRNQNHRPAVVGLKVLTE
jgi:hypothetical protein